MEEPDNDGAQVIYSSPPEGRVLEVAMYHLNNAFDLMEEHQIEGFFAKWSDRYRMDEHFEQLEILKQAITASERAFVEKIYSIRHEAMRKRVSEELGQSSNEPDQVWSGGLTRSSNREP